ncbi:MAG: hypothetical protein ABJF50_24635 [Paracoccaceae bacterium]
MSEEELRDFLKKVVDESGFSIHSDWKDVYPPGRFDHEILAGLGRSMNIQSAAGLRIRKENIEGQYQFLSTILKQISHDASGVMVLNGDTLMFED